MSETFQAGDVLIASAALIDPNFQQSVVLLCDHSREKGAYGLVLNRVVDLGADAIDALPFACNEVFQGGPVQIEAMQILHPFGDAIPGAMKVLDKLWIGGDFEILINGLSTGELPADECRFFLGYSGWEGTQLEAEFEQESWLRVRGSKRLVMDTQPDDMWSVAIRQYGETHPMFAHFPENPLWN